MLQRDKSDGLGKKAKKKMHQFLVGGGVGRDWGV